MEILITGGTTFVSKYAAEFFVAKGNDVTVINRGSRPQVNGVKHINGDRTALGDKLNGKHFDLILDMAKTSALNERSCANLVPLRLRRSANVSALGLCILHNVQNLKRSFAIAYLIMII